MTKLTKNIFTGIILTLYKSRFGFALYNYSLMTLQNLVMANEPVSRKQVM